MVYLTLFCRKFPKKSQKKSQRTGRGGRGVKPVGPNFKLLPKICFASFPYTQTSNFNLFLCSRQTFFIKSIHCSLTRLFGQFLRPQMSHNSDIMTMQMVEIKTCYYYSLFLLDRSTLWDIRLIVRKSDQKRAPDTAQCSHINCTILVLFPQSRELTVDITLWHAHAINPWHKRLVGANWQL